MRFGQVFLNNYEKKKNSIKRIIYVRSVYWKDGCDKISYLGYIRSHTPCFIGGIRVFIYSWWQHWNRWTILLGRWRVEWRNVTSHFIFTFRGKKKFSKWSWMVSNKYKMLYICTTYPFFMKHSLLDRFSYNVRTKCSFYPSKFMEFFNINLNEMKAERRWQIIWKIWIQFISTRMS